MNGNQSLIRSYADRSYKHTTMVRHKGTVVAFALDDARRIYYTVLNLDQGDRSKGPLDANYWLENPNPLRFPNEIAQVGYGMVGATRMPVVAKDSRAEEDVPGILKADEIDPFLSTTARFTTDAPFHVLSDNQHIYVFRQSIDAAHADIVHKLKDGGASADTTRRDADYVLVRGDKFPLVHDTLLLDRFILAGTQLKPKMEIRYKRSRNKTRPASNKDSLGAKDMEGNYFFEPTQELDFIRNLTDGRFNVLLLPTQVADVQRWQLFAHNSRTNRIDSFNIERAADGLFNTRGTQFYTSPDPKYQNAVFERTAGTCPFTDEELIPIVSTEGHAESALEFDGVDDYVEISLPSWSSERLTLEMWLRPGQAAQADSVGIFSTQPGSASFAVDLDGNGSYRFNGQSTSTIGAVQEKWQHLAVSYDGSRIKAYLNGVMTTSFGCTGSLTLSGYRFGVDRERTLFFQGQIDEVRLWNRARDLHEIKNDMNHRLVGHEPGLVGYWRCDEGGGSTVHDQTGGANHGTVNGAAWVTSEAPIGDHPGMRRSSFGLHGRSIESGISSLLYYQQEDVRSGYDAQAKPMKQHARVMLAAATGGPDVDGSATDKKYVAALDFAVSREGKLAQVPDTIDLGAALSKGTNEELVRLQHLEAEAAALEAQVNQTPQFAETGKIKASDKATHQVFGYSVAISGDWAIVGANRGYNEFTWGRTGAAYLFQQGADGKWTQRQKILASDGQENSRFGGSVGISGEWAIVGAPHAQGSDWGAGAAYLFQRGADGNLTQRQKIQASDNQKYDYFGHAVAISGDWAIVGAICEDTGGNDAGAAYLIHRGADGNWTQRQKIQASDKQASWRFGRTVAISGDWAIVGGDARYTGGLYLFERGANGNWTQRQKIQASDKQAGWHFGDDSVAISGDWVIVGEWTTGYRYNGQVYFFQRGADGNWTQRQKIQANDNKARWSFGCSVAISGEWAIVCNDTVRPYLFQRDADGNWAQRHQIQTSYSAWPVAISGDRAIGGNADGHKQSGDDNTDSAYMFDTSLWRQAQQELADKQAETALLRSRLRDDVVLPMSQLHTDPYGLTVWGGLLGFAYSNDTPALFDSATGKLSLYFRGANEQFFAAYYDTRTARARQRLTVGSGRITFLARSAGGAMDQATISVSDGANASTCTVTLANAGLRETWTQVPRDPRKLTAVLNGQASKLVFVGQVGATSGTVTSLSMVGETNQALEEGGTLLVGGSKVTTSGAVSRKATSIPIDSATVTAKAASSVYLLPYDEANATVNQPGYSLRKGSLLFTAHPGSATDPVPNGTATGTGVTPSCRWIADAPGRAFHFDGNDFVAIAADKVEQMDAAGDLTLEAWVQPSEVNGTARVIHHHSDNASYTLGLTEQGSPHVFAGVRDQFIQSTGAIPSGEWSHLTATFNQSYALRFDAGDYLDCGNKSSLDISQDLTLEVFFTVNSLGKLQRVLSKGTTDDGTEQNVPYSLDIDTEGRVAFAFEDGSGGNHLYTSSSTVTANQFCTVAVTRKRGTKTREEKGTEEFEIDGETKTFEVIKSVKVDEWDDISIYIDGNVAGTHQHKGAFPTGHNGALVIGRSLPTEFFEGTISEVRIWNTAREAQELNSVIAGSERGLISWWLFNENEGNSTNDSKGGNHASIKGAEWVKTPDPQSCPMLLYCNGQPLNTEAVAASDPIIANGWGDNQFTLGARIAGSPIERFAGLMEEVRIWKVTRTHEQILDNLFTRLKGEKQDLLANYTFDDVDDTQLKDYSLLRNHLSFGADGSKPSSLLSTAPISNDTAQVRSALAGVETPFHDRIDSRPAVAEYGDMQYDSDGNLTGVLKRCYACIRDGRWQLITGYKVGNLVTEWIGQVQFNPQVIGFIEGAPPAPSENLTAGPVDPARGDYNNVNTMEVVEAKSVNYFLSSSKDGSIDTAFGMSAGIGGNVEGEMMQIVAPLGIGVGLSQQIVDLDFTASIGGKMETSNGWSSEAGVGGAKNVTQSTSVALGGNWEAPDHPLNPALGRRFQPANMGFAVVQSETADVFAMRLAHNNALVSFRFQPNPDIPKDWNVIPFPINPRYTKQGALDGAVGYDQKGKVTDPDYPTARGYGEYSYFKPKEAYALKNRIKREEEQLANYYENFDTNPMGAIGTAAGGAVAGVLAGPIGSAAGAAVGGLVGALSSDKSLAKRISKRNLVNTYVWTADGGFFAESTETSDVRTETVAGSYNFSGSVETGFDTSVTVFGTDVSLEFSASMGGSLNLTKTKSKESENTFSIDVSVGVPGDLQKYDKKLNRVYDADDNPINVEGKVDAYRFMTFYLESAKENFEDLFAKVVDPIWLEQDEHPNAVAMRQAQQVEKTPPCWRVMHRVTFISRILPEFTDSTAPPLEKAMKAQNIESNWQLIQTLSPFVRNKTDNFAQFSNAVHSALATHLPELLPYEAEVIRYFGLYFGIDEEV